MIAIAAKDGEKYHNSESAESEKQKKGIQSDPGNKFRVLQCGSFVWHRHQTARYVNEFRTAVN